MKEQSDLTVIKKLNGRYGSFRVHVFEQRAFPPETLYGEIDRLVRASDRLCRVDRVGNSFEGRPVRLVSVGKGTTSVLLWSQMHGDESTATMAICDVLNFLIRTRKEEWTARILASLRLLFLPMLNPDGAARFQRRTAQMIDVNRDALALQTPEARILKKLQHKFKPRFGFNLHDQELSTIGLSKNFTAIAVLAPAFNSKKSDNSVRDRAKHLAAQFVSTMNQLVHGKIARYDDTYDPRAFGDSVQRLGTSTILVESGHALNDPEKDFIRKLNFVGLLTSFHSIATGDYRTSNIGAYENLPLNGKRAYDVIVRDVRVKRGGGRVVRADLGISYQVDTHSEQPPKLVDLGDLSTFVGLEEIDGKGKVISHAALTLGGAFEWERYFRNKLRARSKRSKRLAVTL